MSISARDTAQHAPPLPDPVTARRAIRKTASRAFRVYGSVTASARPDPDFLLIGSKRGGTTTLYYDILRHPQALPLFPSGRYLPKAETKGAHFFDSNYQRGERWYRSYFPTAAERERAARRIGRPVVVGESSPYYLYHPLAAQRAAAMVPNAKLIVSLRDPVLRAYSHWKDRRLNHAEPLDFPSAVAAEPERTAGEEQRLIDDPSYYSYAHEQQSYLAQSRYAEPLRRWIDAFGRERLLIFPSEDYYRDPAAVLRSISEFLEIDFEPLGRAPHRNKTVGDGIEPDLYARLQQGFADDVAEVEEIVGRRMPWG